MNAYRELPSMKVLMICYYFPPLVDVGCKRSSAFAKYMKAHGWHPHVLSVRNPDRHFCRLGNDTPPPGVPTDYARSLFSLYWVFGKINGGLSRFLKPFGIAGKRNYFYDIFAIPDLFIGWVPGAILRGVRIFRKQGFDCIYVSCSPFSSAFAGMALKRLTGRPLVIDFRDPMALNRPDLAATPSLRRKIDLRLERIIIESADIFIVTTDEVRQSYIRHYPRIEPKIFTVHNGFDHQLAPLQKPEKYHKFTIVYGGNMYFYAMQATAFFAALSRLKQRGRIGSDNFQFLYFGEDWERVQKIADELGIEDLVQVKGTVPHSEMLPILSRSHLQLLRILKPMISTKLFEGIALNIPFLATIPEGEVADLIRRYSPSSYIVTEDSPEKVAEAVMAAMRAYRQGAIEDNRLAQFLENFSRESLSRKLEGIIEQEVPTGSSGRRQATSQT